MTTWQGGGRGGGSRGQLFTVSLRVCGCSCTSSHCKKEIRAGVAECKRKSRDLNTRANGIRTADVEQWGREKVDVPVNMSDCAASDGGARRAKESLRAISFSVHESGHVWHLQLHGRGRGRGQRNERTYAVCRDSDWKLHQGG